MARNLAYMYSTEEYYRLLHHSSGSVEYKDSDSQAVLSVCMIFMHMISRSEPLPFPQEPIVVVITPNVETDSTHPTPTTPPVIFNHEDVSNLLEHATTAEQQLMICKDLVAGELGYSQNPPDPHYTPALPYCAYDSIPSDRLICDDTANYEERLREDLEFLEESSDLIDLVDKFALQQNQKYFIKAYVNQTYNEINTLLSGLYDLLDVDEANAGDGEGTQTGYQNINKPSRCHTCDSLIDVYQNLFELHEISNLVVTDLNCILDNQSH